MALWEIGSSTKCGSCAATEICWTSREYEHPSFCTPRGVDPNHYHQHFVALAEGHLIFYALMCVLFGFLLSFAILGLLRFLRARCRSPLRTSPRGSSMRGPSSRGTLRKLLARGTRGDPPVTLNFSHLHMLWSLGLKIIRSSLPLIRPGLCRAIRRFLSVFRFPTFLDHVLFRLYQFRTVLRFRGALCNFLYRSIDTPY